MTISASKHTLGTAASTIVGPSPEPQYVTIKNLQPSADAREYSRHGLVFNAHSKFTIANGGTAHFQMTTGDAGAQFEYYVIVADASSVYAQLLEGATFGSATAFPVYNLNRNSSDVAQSTLTQATAVSGGSAVVSEYVTASNQAGAAANVDKVVTLKPNSSYVMRFIDAGGTGPTVYFELGFTEQFNGANTAYLNNSTGDAFELRGNEVWHGLLYAGESIDARSTGQDVIVSVLAQNQE